MTLVAAYGFNEGSGTTSAPESGSTWGTATGIPGWGAGRYSGNAMASTTVGATVPFSTSTSFTIMMDVFLSTGTGWRSILEAPSGALYIELEGLVIDVWSNPNISLQGTALTAGWNHIALTATTGSTRLVVNGTTMVTSASKASMPAGNYAVGGSSGQPLNCRVDNLRVYDNVMSDAEIQAIMGTPVGPAPSTSGWKWIKSGGLITLTPQIVTGNGTPPPTTDLRPEIIANVYGAHDATPRGVPVGYSWRDDADTDPNADSTQYQQYGAVNIWGQAFATDLTTAYTARLQVRKPRLWFHNGSTWVEASITPGTMSGAYYPGDFQSGSTSATTQQDAPGEWSGSLSGLNGEPDAFHYWWDGMFPRTAIPVGCQGILVCQEMRLTNAAGANIIASTGSDLFATPQTVVDPQGWNNGIPNPRMIWVTDQWSRFWATTSSLSRLNNTPSPSVG